MKKYFLEKTWRKWGGEANPRHVCKKPKLSISLDQQSEILNSLFLLSVQVKVYQNILKLGCWLLDFILYKMKNKNKKQKTKRSLLPVSQPHFQYDFWSKIFITFCFINWPNFITWLPLILETLCNMFIVVNCCPAVTSYILK